MTDTSTQEFKAFDLLKFPMAVLVVYLHGHITNMSVGGVTYAYSIDKYPIYSNLSYLISELIGYLAVPTFFVISGYLFFKGLEREDRSFEARKYVDKLLRRGKTLLLPYILWNLIYLLLFWAGQTIFPGLMSGNNGLISNYGIVDFINAFWAGNGGFPICTPLWFVRDIIVMVLLAPLFFYLFRYTKWIPLLILAVLWLTGQTSHIYGVDFKSMLFFYGGGYFSCYQLLITDCLRRLKKVLPFLYVATVVLAVFCFNTNDSMHIGAYSGRISLLFGVPLLICIGDMASRRVVSTSFGQFLTASNFFIFAYHILPLSFIIKFLLNAFAPSSELSIIGVYLVSPAITIIIGLLIFAILKKFLPKTTSLLTGGRF